MTQLATSPGVAGLVPAGTWRVDGSHSTIEFGIRHLLITTVKGTFGNFEGTIEVAPDGAATAAMRIGIGVRGREAAEEPSKSIPHRVRPEASNRFMSPHERAPHRRPL